MPMVNNNHGHIFGNGSLNAESDKKYRSCVFIMVMTGIMLVAAGVAVTLRKRRRRI